MALAISKAEPQHMSAPIVCTCCRAFRRTHDTLATRGQKRSVVVRYREVVVQEGLFEGDGKGAVVAVLVVAHTNAVDSEIQLSGGTLRGRKPHRRHGLVARSPGRSLLSPKLPPARPTWIQARW